MWGMRKPVYMMVFNGLADWEPALALCELNKTGKFKTVTVGFNSSSITTMGGIKITPNTTLDKVDIKRAALFIIPGGQRWETVTEPALIDLLHKLHSYNVPIGAICAGTLVVARAGLTREIYHTSNELDYLKLLVPDYRDDLYYRNELAICDNNVITASGVGFVEFAYEIIKLIGIYSPEDAQLWFGLFKYGKMPVQAPTSGL